MLVDHHLPERYWSWTCRLLVADEDPHARDVGDVLREGPGLPTREPWRDLAVPSTGLRYVVEFPPGSPPTYQVWCLRVAAAAELPALDDLRCETLAVVHRLAPEEGVTGLVHGLVLVGGSVWKAGDVDPGEVLPAGLAGAFRSMFHLRPSSL